MLDESGNSAYDTSDRDHEKEFWNLGVMDEVIRKDIRKPVNQTERMILFTANKGMENYGILTNIYGYSWDSIDKENGQSVKCCPFYGKPD